MILDNCQVLTMDPRMPTASALAIAGGRIVGGVDSREDAIASQAHERVDAGGAWVIPGFVDAHVHFAGWALSRERLELGACRSAEDLVATVRTHAEDLDASATIEGMGWDELTVFGDGIPEGLGATLMAAADGRALLLGARDGHSLLTTDATLVAAGVDGGALSEHGPVEDLGGALLLREGAAWLVRQRAGNQVPTVAAMARAMREALARGVTAVHDMDGASAFANWRALDAERGLKLRVWQHIHRDELDAAETLRLGAGFGSDFLRLAGLKVFADGTLSSRTAWLEGDAAGTPLLDKPTLQDLAQRASRAGLPLVVHAIGDAAAAAAAAAIIETGHAADSRLGRARPRIEHAQLLDDDTLRACVEHGIVLSIQPAHFGPDRAGAERAWADRLHRAYRWQDMEQAGAHLVLGSDAPVENLSPSATLAAATATPPDDRWAHAQLSADAALAASTVDAHAAVGADHELGRLTKGYRADLAVLADDPRTHPDAEVVATMVDGRFVHGRDRLGQA